MHKKPFKNSIVCLTFLLAIVSGGCKSENKSSMSKKTLPKFNTVNDMLDDAGDFYVENGSLKFISEDVSNFHIQVSKPSTERDLESVKKEIVMRNIVYVSFQTFAQTDLDEITITSVPSDDQNTKKYFEEYKKTVRIKRSKAKAILKRYLESNDFSILFTEENGIWLPNKNFSKLQFEKLQEVFDEMVSH